MYIETEYVMEVQGHPRSLILVPMVRNFLLVINSNLGAILHRCSDIGGFLLRTATPAPPYFTRITFEVTQPIHPRTSASLTGRQTDRQTDNLR